MQISPANFIPESQKDQQSKTKKIIDQKEKGKEDQISSKASEPRHEVPKKQSTISFQNFLFKNFGSFLHKTLSWVSRKENHFRK